MNWVDLFFTPRGRVGRGLFWAIFGAWLGIDLLLRGGISAAARWSGNEVFVALLFWGWLSFTCITYFPMLALGIKRLHDIGRSGWWMALPVGTSAAAVLMMIALFRQQLGSALVLLPLTLLLGAGSLVTLVFWLLPGDDDNAHGVA
ncbi:MAG TPA: DUF805 domain-containing protein [Arenimonas sp.]|nr:DUF805 domain-containing protein [Arenimonas sp.]